MAKVVDALPKRLSGKQSSVDLTPYLDGQAWHLVAGEDFEVKAATVRSLVATVAKEHGLKGRSRLVPDGIVIQFTPSTASTLTSEEF